MADLIPLQGSGSAVPPVLDGEVLPPERKTGVSLQSHPFSQLHVRFEVAEGSTLYAIVLSAGFRDTILRYVRVWIGDEEIPLEVWHLVRPKAGTEVFIKLTPGGGGDMTRSLLMLAVVVAATFIAGPLGAAVAGGLGLGAVGASVATALISTGISMLGMWLVNMLVPPPKGPKLSERAFLDALRNRFNPFGPLPRITGKRRVYPVMAAHPYTESSGGKRYLRAMLLVGFGPLRISDIRIGESPINTYNNVTVEVREGWYDEAWGKFKLISQFRSEFDTTTESWAGSGCTLAVVNGVLRVTPSTADPIVTRSGLAINGQRDYIVRAKVRRVSGSSWQGQVFYSNSGHGYSGLYYKGIPNPFTRDGEWIICEWDMSALSAGGSDWRSTTITGLRLDLSNDTNSVYEVEWIEVGYPCGKDAARQLYTKSISQLDVGAKLTSGVQNIRTTEPDSIGFGVDVQLPGGLGQNDKDNAGDIDNESVTVRVEYRKLGTTQWKRVNWSSNIGSDGTGSDGELTYKAKERSEVMLGGWADFPEKGQYEVRLIRTTEDWTSGNKFGETYWQSLRSIKDTPSINDDLVGGLAIISIRAKATDQFTSFPDQINCIAESYLPIPNSDGGWTYEPTRNPAWAFTDILRHRGREPLIDTSRMNMNAIRDWGAACDQTAPNSTKPYWRVDAQLEDGSLFDNCREIAAHARASFIVESGLYSVVRDIPQTVPVQLITPKNSWGYNGMKQFIDLPHALRINFTNADKYYRQDERIVYDDGYSKENASRFETIDYSYCTDPDQAFREARYHLAIGKLRPEQHRVTMDVENLRCTMGDYVMLAHDVLSIGTGQGRVTALTGTTTITAFTLDEPVALSNTRNYGVRYRRSDTGTIYTAQLAAITTTGEYATLTFSAGIAASTAPKVGDLIMVGEFGVESAPMLVKRIEPGPDMTATLTLVDAQPGVWTADQAEIPPFNSYITDEVQIPQQRPATPTFRLVSDEQALVRQSDGSLPDQIMVVITPPTASKLAATGFHMQWRRSPGSDAYADWSSIVETSNGNNTLYIPQVRTGRSYDVRVRSISQYGLTSDWVEIDGHIVVGKTAPPGPVVGLTAAAGIEGVQLSWTPNADLDLKGYIVKSGSGWDTATLVSEVLAGTSIFVKSDTSKPQTFIVRAIDVVGNLSLSDAQVTTAAVTPEPVLGLEGYLQMDVVFLKWKPVSMVGVRYEVRQGSDWKTARLIGTVSNEEIRTRLPTTATVERVFWVEAISSLGALSGTPASVTLTILPVDNQNVLATRDLVALSFPGKKQDVAASGSALLLSVDGSGNQYPRGEYTATIDLGGSFQVRSWIDLDSLSVAGSGATWASSTYSWASAANQTWLGTISDNRAGDITPRIAIDSGFDSSLIEGWRWNGSANGSKLGTAPAVNVNGNFATDGRFDQGALFSRNVKLSYAVSIPSVYTIALDARMRLGVNNFLLFKLIGSGIALWAVQNQSENIIAVFDHLGNVLRIPYTSADNDVVTLVLTQSGTQRSLYANSRRSWDVVSATALFPALGAFTSIAFY